MLNAVHPVSDPQLRSYLASERAAVDYCNEVVDGMGRQLYLDKVGSVSGLERERDLRILELINPERSEGLHGS